MTTLEIIATVIAVLAIIAIIVAVIVLWSANDDWNAEGYGMDKNTERENFEAWALTDDGNCNHQDLRKNRDGEYINLLVERDFLVWQACTKFASPAAELTDADSETVLSVVAWLRGAAQGDRKNVNRGEAADALQRLLARSPAQPASGEVRKIRAAFHVNMMRAYPGKTHDEISAEIDRALATPAAPEQKAEKKGGEA